MWMLFDDPIRYSIVDAAVDAVVSVTASSSEAKDRHERSAQEAMNLMRDMKHIETELHSCRAENYRLAEALQAERGRAREQHMDKLTVERRLAELTVVSARAESAVDESRSAANSIRVDLERSERVIAEQRQAIVDLKSKRDEACGERSLLVERVDSLTRAVEERARGEQVLAEQLRAAEMTRETARRECDMLERSVTSQRSVLDETLMQLDRCQGENAELRRDREIFRRDKSLAEGSRAEGQLRDLRADMERTICQWKEAECSRAQHEDQVRAVSLQLGREREKVLLMSTQIALQEDRLKVAMEELGVFRSLDIYQQSMRAELKSYQTRDRALLTDGSLRGSGSGSGGDRGSGVVGDNGGSSNSSSSSSHKAVCSL